MKTPDLVQFELTKEQGALLAPVLYAQEHGDGYTILILDRHWNVAKEDYVIRAHCKWLSKPETDLLAKQMMKIRKVENGET
jgi:hypothetical protein